MKIVVLADSEYQAAYRKAFESPDDVPLEVVQAELRLINERLQVAIGRERWTDSDIQISDEWQESFHHCGGLYSKATLSPKTLEIIIESLEGLDHANRWHIHFACEPEEEIAGIDGCGEFFVHAGRAYFTEADQGFPDLFAETT